MKSRHLYFLKNGGECGEIIRNLDWQYTPLGHIEDWPLSLYTCLGLLLGSRFPMFLYWGPQRICFYNDAFRPSLGNPGKHPAAMGRPAAEVWPELWGHLQGTLDQIITQGQSTWKENFLVPIFRNDTLENAYWTYSSTAVNNDNGEPYGILSICMETTPTVMARQKLEETNEWLEIALKAGGMGTWDLNTTTYKFHATGLTKQLFGLPDEGEVDLQLALANIIEPDRNRVVDAIQDAIKNGSRYDINYTVKAADGQENILHARGKLYYTEDGIANRFAGIVQNVTEDIAARQQQQQLASLVENSQDCMFIANLENRIIYLNIAGRLLTGIGPEADLRRFRLQDFFTMVPATTMAKLLRSLETTGKWSGPITLQHLEDGAAIPCLANAVNIYDPGTGLLIARGITLRDLRSEVASENAIRDSKDRLTLAMKATNLGTYDWLIKENTLTWDSRCRQLFGIDDGEEVTYVDTFLNGLHPDDRLQTELAIAKALDPASDGAYTARYRTISPEGKTLYWVQAMGRCIFDAQRQPVRLIGTVLDITGQIAAQEDIAEREAHFRLLIDAIGQLVWIADVEGNIFYINKSSYQYTDEANKMRSVTAWADLLHPAERENYLKSWEMALATGEEWVQEHRLCHRNKHYRWHLTRVTPYRDSYSNIDFWVSTSTDIQLIKDQEEQKNDFFQMASHELKTPVTSLKAYAQFLHKRFEKANDDTNAGFLSKMGTQIHKLEVLIKDLLDINRIEGGKMQFNNAAFNFRELVIEIVEEMQRTTSKQLILHLQDKPWVWGDRDRLGQVLINLISNAIKYSPKADRVEIGVAIEENQVVCRVTDFGIGIPAEQQQHVFNRFYRVSGQNTDTFPGLGLGLYISSEIIKRQNGSIWVRSQPQEGSDFCFQIPLFTNEKESLRS